MNYNKAVEYLENIDEIESKIFKQHLNNQQKPNIMASTKGANKASMVPGNPSTTKATSKPTKNINPKVMVPKGKGKCKVASAPVVNKTSKSKAKTVAKPKTIGVKALFEKRSAAALVGWETRKRNMRRAARNARMNNN